MVKHFEFIGIPGSGKTTLKKDLINRLNRSDLNAFSLENALINSNIERMKADNANNLKFLANYFGYILVTKKFSSIFRYSNYQISAYNKFVTSNPNLTYFVLEVLNNQKIEKEKKEYIMDLIFSNFSDYQIINSNLHKNELIINDEGFCHRVVAIWGRDKNYYFSKKEIYNYMNLIPLPDIVFVVNAGIEQSEERLSNRGYPTILKGLEYAERIKRLCFIKEIINYTISILKGKSVKIVYLNNNTEGNITMPKAIIDEVNDWYRTI